MPCFAGRATITAESRTAIWNGFPAGGRPPVHAPCRVPLLSGEVDGCLGGIRTLLEGRGTPVATD